jgi:hypothetical protein
VLTIRLRQPSSVSLEAPSWITVDSPPGHVAAGWTDRIHITFSRAIGHHSGRTDNALDRLAGVNFVDDGNGNWRRLWELSTGENRSKSFVFSKSLPIGGNSVPGILVNSVLESR